MDSQCPSVLRMFDKRCELRDGHNGDHQANYPGAVVKWDEFPMVEKAVDNG